MAGKYCLHGFNHVAVNQLVNASPGSLAISSGFPVSAAQAQPVAGHSREHTHGHQRVAGHAPILKEHPAKSGQYRNPA